jgi:hypothetical protein
MRIKNWEKYQNFKDRRPPWIKLHRDLLDDKEFHELSGPSVKVLIFLWLLASEDETKQGSLPPVKKIAFRLRMTDKALKSIVSTLDHWLIQDAPNLGTHCHQLGRSETETETETETEKITPVPGEPVPLTVDDIQIRWNAIDGIKPCKKIEGALFNKVKKLLHAHPTEWWSDFFFEISSSPFLTGKVLPTQGKKLFRANLDWVTGPINLGKILAGNYADEKVKGRAVW